MRLEMVAAVRTNAFQAPSLKQHEAGLRSVEDAHRQAQRHARQHPPPQPQLQQRGALRGQQPSPRAFPGAAAAAAGKPPADASESFQRPSPGDSNNSETTASTPPTVGVLYSATSAPNSLPLNTRCRVNAVTSSPACRQSQKRPCLLFCSCWGPIRVRRGPLVSALDIYSCKRRAFLWRRKA